MAEVWRPIPGFDGYEASSEGNLRGPKGILKAPINSRGYRQLRLCGKTVKVHRLVMLAFCGPSNLDTNHKNGIKADNRLTNLEYVTRGENNRHAWRTGLNRSAKGIANANAKLTEKQIIEILESPLKTAELARKIGFHETTVGQVRTGRRWKHITAPYFAKRKAAHGGGEKDE